MLVNFPLLTSVLRCGSGAGTGRGDRAGTVGGSAGPAGGSKGGTGGGGGAGAPDKSVEVSMSADAELGRKSVEEVGGCAEGGYKEQICSCQTL